MTRFKVQCLVPTRDLRTTTHSILRFYSLNIKILLRARCILLTDEFTVNIALTIMTTWGWVEADTVAVETAKEALKYYLQRWLIYGLFTDCLNRVCTSVNMTLMQPLKTKLFS